MMGFCPKIAMSEFRSFQQNPPTMSMDAFDDGRVSLSSLGWRRPFAALCAQDRFEILER